MTCHECSPCAHQVAYDLATTHALCAKAVQLDSPDPILDRALEFAANVRAHSIARDADTKNSVIEQLTGIAGRLILQCEAAGVPADTILDCLMGESWDCVVPGDWEPQ